MALITSLIIITVLLFSIFLFLLFTARVKLYLILASGVLSAVSALSLACVLICLFSSYGNRVGSTTPQVVEIRRGLSLYSIGGLLRKNNIIDSSSKFILAAKLLGVEKGLKAGKYEIPAKSSYNNILQILYSGKGIQEKVTFPEGILTRDIALILEKRIGINRENFLDLIDDKEFIKTFGLDVPSLNGFLLPETYTFYWGMSEKEVISAFLKEFKKILTDSVMTKIEESKYSLLEYVILASIIEGEALYDTERALISGVYHNRLKKHIRLQADPTIQYIIEGGPRRLLRDDLKIDSPYNTYLYGGLPPGPISNPGRSSILAAIFPSTENYLYFVARGDGYHTFSKSNREHIKAKRKFNKIRRKLKRKQRE